MTDPTCPFCSIVTDPSSAHVVASDDDIVAFLDIRPVFKGHVLLVPRQHHETLADLPSTFIAPVFGWAQRLSRAVRDAVGAEGTFVAMNNTVSQSVPHLHVHVVPRTKGDGLRGFFWPRQRYTDEAEMAATAELVRTALEA